VPSRPSLRRLDAATLADRAYDALREAIISGELAPGEKITERGLAERLAVSATPVREALRRLEQDRLVERRGPRLVQVAALDDGNAREVRLAEGALRAVAARLAVANATDAQRDRMAGLLDAGDAELARLQAAAAGDRPLTSAELTRLLDITRAFHAALNEACNNDVILRLLSLVDAFRLAARHQRLSAELSDDGAAAALERFAEHRAVFDALQAGDADAVERLMRAHAQADVSADADAYALP
jgi:DNA-binding GntR family transcriptional regulator